MSNYTKATNFASKDALPVGDANKKVKGVEIDNEFNAIANAVSTKADLQSPAFTGTPSAPTAASGTNTTQIATTAFVLANSVPSGAILMWSGTVANIPTGWVLCDGSNSTPDLTGRFVIHADADSGGTYDVGDTGGSADAVVVSHTHTQAAHDHLIMGYTGGGLPSGGGGGYSTTVTDSNRLNAVAALANADTSYALKGTTNAADRGLSSSVAPTITSTGVSGTNANLPPYYALAYIMKT